MTNLNFVFTIALMAITALFSSVFGQTSNFIAKVDFGVDAANITIHNSDTEAQTAYIIIIQDEIMGRQMTEIIPGNGSVIVSAPYVQGQPDLICVQVTSNQSENNSLKRQCILRE